jgi:hypothetical protein
MKAFKFFSASIVLGTGAKATAAVVSLFGFYPGKLPLIHSLQHKTTKRPESTNSSLFAHRTSFDYGFGTNLVPTNTCVSSNLVNNQVQFKIDGVQQVWGRFFYGDYNLVFCVMGYKGAECLDQYLQTLHNWTSSSTCKSFRWIHIGDSFTCLAIEESEYGSPAAYNLTTLARSAKVVSVSRSIAVC